MHSITPGNLCFYLVPGPGDEETFVHGANHLLKLLHRDGKGQDVNRNAGSCRRIEHTQDSTGVITLPVPGGDSG